MKIKKSELKQLISETVQNVLEEKFGILNEIPQDEFVGQLTEMADIVRFPSGGLKVSVWNNDGGSIPHFHIVDTATSGGSFNSAIFIGDNRYFTHGSAVDVLNRKQRKILDILLSGTDEDGDSNWEYLIKTWNKNNSKAKIPNTMKTNKPDYNEIKPYKED